MSKLQPMLFTTMKNYSLKQFYNDVIAGIIVSIIALPLSIALAMSSGVKPEQGLYTAIVAGFIISFLGGSRVQIGGPTGAFMVIVYGIVYNFGMDGLIIATIMGGFFMILMGLFKLGSVIKFIPYPITTGFTSGIALTIFSSQIKDFFGLKTGDVPADFLGKWKLYFSSFNTIDYQTLFMGALALLIIIFWPKINRKIPGSLIAIIVTTLIVLIFDLESVQTIGDRFPDISSSLPKPSFPNITMDKISLLIGPAITIAILGSIESLLSAVVSDGMIGAKHRSNMELVAQGTANIASGIFGGIPATGAIARTVANIKNGGRTPVSGMVHALSLLLILVTFMPLAKLIPLSSLAAVLIIVAYNMSGWREFKELFKTPKSDIIVLLITFSVTVLIDLVKAIEIGMVLAALLFMKRMSDVTFVKNKTFDASEDEGEEEEQTIQTPKGVEIYEINGPFFFGAADKFIEIAKSVSKPTKFIIIRMRNVPAMDATALVAFKRFIDMCKGNHTQILISGINEQPKSVLQKAEIYDYIGEDHFFKTVDQAVNYATNNLNEK